METKAILFIIGIVLLIIILASLLGLNEAPEIIYIW